MRPPAHRARISNLALVGVLLISGFASVARPGQVYRWRDSDGSVHYSDRQPQNKARTIAPAPVVHNRMSPLSSFERQQVHRFDERVGAHLRARRAAARSMAADKVRQRRACEGIKRELGQLRAKRRNGLAVRESNEARARELWLHRERMQLCE